jgi:glycerophosphoryl diester phosphodiesterase
MPTPRPARPRLYAHRGAGVELPENTLPSFRLALELGADALETDAHLTRDGHVVLSHDPTGQRMCGVPTPIARATLDEVQAWDAGAGFVDAARNRPHAGKGYRIPTLGEALEAFPEVAFNVDAKSRHPEMVARTLDAVNRAGAADRTLLASFDARTLREVRRLGYRGATGLAQSEVLRLLLLPRRLATPAWVRRLDRLGFGSAAAAQLPYRIYGIDLGTRAVVEKCHALGLEAHYWTVNEPALATRLLEVGADAIMTDDPRRVGPAVKGFRRSGS